MRLVDQKVPPVDDATDTSPQSHGVGDLLKASRMRLGADLHDVASALRIRYPYLEAIEAGRYKDLPGTTYVVGFIRAYADHLGLDGEEVLRRYKAEAAGGDKTVLSFPEPIPDTGMPGGAIVIIAVILAGMVYGGWYMKSSDQNFMSTAVEPVPEELAEKKPATQVADDVVSENVTIPETETQQTVPQAGTGSPETAVEKILETVEKAVEETVERAAQETTEVQTEETAEQARNVVAEIQPQTTAEQSAPSELSPVTAPPTETPTTDAPANETLINENPVATQTNEVVPTTDVAEIVTPVTPEVSVTPVTPTATVPHDDAVPEPTVQPEHVDGDDGRPTVESEQLNADAETKPVAVVDTENTVEQGAEQVAEQTETPSTVGETIEPLVNQSQTSDPGADVADNESNVTPTETATETATKIESAIETERPASTPVAADTEKTETASLSAPEPAQPRIIIKAKSNGWIQIFDETKNQLLATRLLRQGDIYQVPDQSGLKLLTGKPDALEILVDGKQVPDITAAAAQQNGVKLDPALLLSGQATE